MGVNANIICLDFQTKNMGDIISQIKCFSKYKVDDLIKFNYDIMEHMLQYFILSLFITICIFC